MADFLAQIFQELIIQNLNYVGASIKWIFLRKKYSFKELLDQNWNTRIGALVIVALIALIVYLS